MKGAGHIAVLALLVCCIGSGCSDKTEGEPDLLNGFSMNRDENLVVIANRDKIEDKDEFARLLVRMCKENSFHSIKFSTDCGYATSLDMRVYLWRDEVEGNDPVMTVEYKKSENTYKFNQTFRKGNSRGLVFMGIEEMKAVDIRTVVPESLVDVTGTLISDDMTKEERAAEFVKQVKNPYCFRVGDMVVKNVYSSEGISLKDCFEQFARTLKEVLRIRCDVMGIVVDPC